MLLNKHNLQIAELAPNKESRYTLRAILVTPKWTVTTNGCYLVAVTLPAQVDSNFPAIEGFTAVNGAGKQFLLDGTTALDVMKALPKKNTIPVLLHAAVGVETETSLSLAVTDLDSPKLFAPRKGVGQFPAVEAVIPKDEAATVTIGLDAEYLKKLADSALKTCKGDRGREVTITLRVKDANSAVKMTARNADTGQEWMAVLIAK